MTTEVSPGLRGVIYCQQHKLPVTQAVTTMTSQWRNMAFPHVPYARCECVCWLSFVTLYWIELTVVGFDTRLH